MANQNNGRRQQMSVGFSQAQHRWLEAQAERRGIKKAEYVRRLVDQTMLGDGKTAASAVAEGGRQFAKTLVLGKEG